MPNVPGPPFGPFGPARRHIWIGTQQQQRNTAALWETASRYYSEPRTVITAPPVVAGVGGVQAVAIPGGLSITTPETADEPAATLTIVTGEAQAGDASDGSLVALVAVSGTPGSIVLGVLAALGDGMEGVVWGLAAMLIFGYLYMNGNLDPIDRWVREHKRRR